VKNVMLNLGLMEIRLDSASNKIKDLRDPEMKGDKIPIMTQSPGESGRGAFSDNQKQQL